MTSLTDTGNASADQRTVAVSGIVPQAAGLCSPVDGNYHHLVHTLADVTSLDTERHVLAATGVSGPMDTFVVVDTGVNADHPDLRGLLVADRINCTGEPDGDQHGHGTAVALIALGVDALDEELRRRHRFLDVKVIEHDGRTRPETVIDGLDRLAEHAMQHPDEHFSVNLSLGRLRRRLLHKAGCDGTCELCDAAFRLAQLPNVAVFAAAGNSGVTECPAAAAFRPGSLVNAVSANLSEAAPGTLMSEGTRSFGPAGDDGSPAVMFDGPDAVVAEGLLQALAAMAAGDVAAALPDLLRARAREDSFLAPQAAMQLAQVARERQQPELERREYQYGYDHGLSDIRAWAAHELGLLDLRAGDRPAALAHLREAAVGQEPITALANRNLAAMLLEDGDLQGALEALRRAAADTNSPWAQECAHMAEEVTAALATTVAAT